jgi:hypothetical protein
MPHKGPRAVREHDDVAVLQGAVRQKAGNGFGDLARSLGLERLPHRRLIDIGHLWAGMPRALFDTQAGAAGVGLVKRVLEGRRQEGPQEA